MAIGSSIVGVWSVAVDWGDTGDASLVAVVTFDADGSWTYSGGGGQWIQVEGMCFFNFDNAPLPGLVYTGNVTIDIISGIMGYANASAPGISGVWWGMRLALPHLTPEQQWAAPDAEHDLLLGPRPES